MEMSLSQNILIILVRLTLSVLWALDVCFTFDPVKLLKRVQYSFLAVVSGVTIALIVFSLRTGFAYKLVDSLLNAQKYAVLTDQLTKPANSAVLGAQDYPRLIKKDNLPEVSAKAYVVIDKKNGKVLQAFNEHTRLALASTTKLMTSLVAFELYNMTDDAIDIPKECPSVLGTKAYFPEGMHFKVKDLLYSMLVESAGDSACALASAKIPTADFVELMNGKAIDLELNDTHFSNPIGLDSAMGDNYSTAGDLYSLSVYAMKNPMIRDIVKTKEFTLTSIDKSFTTKVANTNKLLWEIPETIGVKTGTTAEAGEVLIYEYQTDSLDLVTVVMGSSDRFKDTKALLNWALTSFAWETK